MSNSEPQRPKLTTRFIRGLFAVMGPKSSTIEIPEFVPTAAVRNQIRKAEMKALAQLAARPDRGTPKRLRYGKKNLRSRLVDKSIALRKDRERRAALAQLERKKAACSPSG